MNVFYGEHSGWFPCNLKTVTSAPVPVAGDRLPHIPVPIDRVMKWFWQVRNYHLSGTLANDHMIHGYSSDGTEVVWTPATVSYGSTMNYTGSHPENAPYEQLTLYQNTLFYSFSAYSSISPSPGSDDQIYYALPGGFSWALPTWFNMTDGTVDFNPQFALSETAIGIASSYYLAKSLSFVQTSTPFPSAVTLSFDGISIPLWETESADLGFTIPTFTGAFTITPGDLWT